MAIRLLAVCWLVGFLLGLCGSVVIVVVEPVGEGLGSGFFVGPGLLVDPLWFQGLVVAFHLPVLLRVVGLDGYVFDPVALEERLEQEAAFVA